MTIRDHIDSEILELVEHHANVFSIDQNLIIAIMDHESNSNPWAMRYEPMVSQKYMIQYRDFASHLGISAETERVCQMSSFGLMQVMGFVARELGHKTHLTELFDPSVGIYYGCRHLRRLQTRYQVESDVIAAYNMGSNRKTAGGFYENQKNYVDPICEILRDLRRV